MCTCIHTRMCLAKWQKVQMKTGEVIAFILCEFIASRVNVKVGSVEFIHVVNLWPEGKGSNSSQRSWQEPPVKLRVSGRRCWNREHWFVVILKLLGLEVQLLLEPPSSNNGLMGLKGSGLAPFYLVSFWLFSIQNQEYCTLLLVVSFLLALTYK